MGRKNKKITILMPVYNGEQHLKQAIESVLGQTFVDFELLIIDDGSNDGSGKIINSYEDERIRLVKNKKNKGIIFSLNKGLALARGEYIARMDADDISLPERLSKQYRFMENNPGVALVGCWAKIIGEDGRPLNDKRLPSKHGEIKFNLLFRNPFIHSSIFFRKNLIKAMGGYDYNYKHAEDFALYSKLIKNNLKTVNLPEFLIKFRVHGGSIGQTTSTKSIQDKTAAKIMMENINNYFPTDSRVVEMIRGGEKINKIKNLLKTLSAHKKIFQVYATKENLNKRQIAEILPFYKERRKNIIRRYIKDKLFQ